jgi:hypothetical protein
VLPLKRALSKVIPGWSGHTITALVRYAGAKLLFVTVRLKSVLFKFTPETSRLLQDGVGVLVGVREGVKVRLGVRVKVGVEVLEGVNVAVSVGVSDGVGVSEGVSVIVGVKVGVLEGVNVSVFVAVGKEKPPPLPGPPTGATTISAILNDSLTPER